MDSWDSLAGGRSPGTAHPGMVSRDSLSRDHLHLLRCGDASPEEHGRDSPACHKEHSVHGGEDFPPQPRSAEFALFTECFLSFLSLSGLRTQQRAKGTKSLPSWSLLPHGRREWYVDAQRRRKQEEGGGDTGRRALISGHPEMPEETLTTRRARHLASTDSVPGDQEVQSACGRG